MIVDMVKQINLIVLVVGFIFLSSCIIKQNPSVNSRTLSNLKSNSGMFLAFDPSSIAEPIVWVSVDNPNITNVALCKGVVSKCKETLAQDITFLLPPEGKRENRFFFKSNKKLSISEEVYSILGLDSNKKLLDIKGIKFVQGQNTSLGLSSDQDLSLKQSGGSSVKLSQLFTGDYFILDFSSANCSGCVSSASDNNNNEEFINLFKNQKCQFAALIPDNELSDWNSAIGGANSFIAKKSYGITSGHVTIGKLFGFTINGIPTILMIDRNGKVIDSADGELSEKAKNLCSGTNSSSEQNNNNQDNDTNDSDNESEDMMPSGNCGPSGLIGGG